MKVTSDMVKALQGRIDVTYEEAEKALIKTDGDIDRAEHLLHRRRNTGFARLLEEGERIYRESLTYYVKIIRRDKTVMDLPLLIIVGLFLLMNQDSKLWVAVVAVGLIFISESTVTIYRVQRQKKDLMETEAPRETADEPEAEVEATEAMDEAPSEEHKNTKDDDDYYEITIKK